MLVVVAPAATGRLIVDVQGPPGLVEKIPVLALELTGPWPPFHFVAEPA